MRMQRNIQHALYSLPLPPRFLPQPFYDRKPFSRHAAVQDQFSSLGFPFLFKRFGRFYTRMNIFYATLSLASNRRERGRETNSWVLLEKNTEAP